MKTFWISLLFIYSTHTSTVLANTGFAVTSCEKIIENLKQKYQTYYQYLPATERARMSSNTKAILNASKSHCSDPSKQAKLEATIMNTIRTSPGKVSVILPMKSLNPELPKSILSGVLQAIEHHNKPDLKNTLQLIDSTTSDEIAIAKAILIHNSDIIIAKSSDERVQFYKNTAQLMRIPIVLLNNSSASASEKFSFFIHPQTDTLAQTLTRAIVQQNIYKIATLTPQNHNSSISDFLLKRGRESGLQIIQAKQYQKDDFESLDLAVQELLGLNYTERAQEHRELILKRKKVAEKEGLPFKAEQVRLAPKYEFSALYIGDNFKVARHVVKLLKFYGVKNLPLIGNPSWRDIALVKPFDAFLKNSFFVDYVGLYNKLPFNIEQQNDDGTLLSADIAQQIDFRLMGFRAGTILANAYQKRFSTRAKLAEIIASQTLPKDAFFTINKAFDSNSRSHWPAFVFKLAPESLLIQNETPPSNAKKPYFAAAK